MIIYLYVKTHRQTGLKYLGQTTQDPYKYKGSGKYWKNHIKTHDNDVETIILRECKNRPESKEFGLYYSELWNVTDSEEWANLKPENGRDGSLPGQWVGEKSPMYGRRGESHPAFGRVDSDETNELRAEAKRGSKNPFFGVTGKDHPCSNKDQDGLKNPNSDTTSYIFEHIETGQQYYMTRHEFKALNLIFKTGVDRIARGQLKSYKGWRVIKD